MHKRLSTIDRVLALLLSLVWTGGGGIAMVLAVRSGEWFRIALATFALLYGVAWLFVVILGRKLSWEESLRFW